MSNDAKDADAPSRRPAKKRKDSPGQVADLFLSIAQEFGIDGDRDVAELAGVSVENVANWRTGAVQEFKPQKLAAIKARLAAMIRDLQSQAGTVSYSPSDAVQALEIELGSGPADLQRQFRDRVVYDYLGHRFLYYDPMGALAWENLIKRGYDQDRWLTGTRTCAEAWLNARRDVDGAVKGPLADALGFARRGQSTGLDLISLGPGEGDKENLLLKLILEAESPSAQRLQWLSYAPVDVSIPLLLGAARAARRTLGEALAETRRLRYQVRPFCADFEEGSLDFVRRLPTAHHENQNGVRVVLMLGNTFGNLRDEETFVRERLWQIARPGDLVWLEVGLRLRPLENDPLFRMTQGDRAETAAEANRRLLLEGPYRRWEAATGRPRTGLDMRVWVREDDDTTRVPGSINFCHDLVINDERRVLSMLYSRRYDIELLCRWMEGLGFSVLRLQRVDDSRHQARVAHLLLCRTEPR